MARIGHPKRVARTRRATRRRRPHVQRGWWVRRLVPCSAVAAGGAEALEAIHRRIHRPVPHGFGHHARSRRGRSRRECGARRVRRKRARHLRPHVRADAPAHAPASRLARTLRRRGSWQPDAGFDRLGSMSDLYSQSTGSDSHPDRPVGKARSTGLTILLVIVTLGIWSLLWIFWSGEDLKRY